MNQIGASTVVTAPHLRVSHSIRDSISRQPAVWIVALLVGLVHAATAGRYDAQRNELYFLVCGWHPDFGYVDQPPLVPLISAAAQIFGINIWMLRLPATIAARSGWCFSAPPLPACSAARAGRRCLLRLRPASRRVLPG
jgi:hypothetical protein